MENNQLEEERLSFLQEIDDLLNRKMLTEALNAAEERISRLPFDAEARGVLNQILIEMGRIEESRVDLLALEKYLNTLSLVFLRAGNAYYEKGLKQDAISCYQKFNGLNPHSEHTAEVTEKMMRLQSESDEGEKASATAMPGPEFYTVTLADLYIQQDHLSMAADVLQEIICRDPANVQG